MNEPVYLSVDTIKNTRVFDNTGVQIGQIDDLLIDRETNKIACAVLSFGHHLMGIGNKYLSYLWKPSNMDNMETIIFSISTNQP